MDDFEETKVARVKPATRMLQALSGRGKVKKELVEHAEVISDKITDKVEVTGFYEEHLQQMKGYLSLIQSGDANEDTIDKITQSISNFRADVGTFGNNSLITIASVLLIWIESIEQIDQDVEDVLSGYVNTTEKIADSDAFTPEQIALIAKELENACQRYFAKHPELTLYSEMNNDRAFYINEDKLGAEVMDSLLDQELEEDNLIGEDEE